jgi:hypothetical protein
MPDKVVMIRHGQSEGNVNEALYSKTPDNAMRLTKLGWEQARKAGEAFEGTSFRFQKAYTFYRFTICCVQWKLFTGICQPGVIPKEFDHIQDRKKRLKAWCGRLLELANLA